LKWLAQLKEGGTSVKTLEEVPEILPHALWLWTAFSHLSQKRAITEDGPFPIPTTEILAYANYHAIPHGSARDDLYEIVGLLDQTYLTFVEKKRRAQREKDERAQKRGRPFKRR
jgi:hypothetical protein